MLDIGWQELFIVAVLAIIIVGPKDLPRALKTIMHYVRKARGLAREFQSGVDEMVREADLDDLKKDLNKISSSDGLESTVKETLDPDGDLDKDMNMMDVQKELNETARDAVKETEPDKPEAANTATETADESLDDDPDQDDPGIIADHGPEPEPVTANTETANIESEGDSKAAASTTTT